jgi:hypothetical protein
MCRFWTKVRGRDGIKPVTTAGGRGWGWGGERKGGEEREKEKRKQNKTAYPPRTEMVTNQSNQSRLLLTGE